MNISITESNHAQIVSILNELPSAMIILQSGKIIFSNTAATNLRQNMEGEYLEDILNSKVDFAKERLYKIQFQNEPTKPTEYEVITSTGDTIYVEATAYPIHYYNEIAVLVIAQNITERKQDVLKTALVQRKQFQVITVKANSLLVDSLYQPALDIGGDFYFFHTINNHELIGVIGDVSGKGTLAAMLISSFEVLFHEAISSDKSLTNIVDFINNRLALYFSDRYVAALFFRITKEHVEFISCGINKFISIHNSGQHTLNEIKGAFLGMFNSDQHLFDSLIMDKTSLKRLVLFTDGMEHITGSELNFCNLCSGQSSTEMISDMNNRIALEKKKNNALKDDVSLLSIDLDFNGKLYEYIINSLAELKQISDTITLPFEPKDRFNIKLIITELVTNAYKHGNSKNLELPIGIKIIHTDTRIIVKVTDMAIKPKNLNILKELNDDSLLSENGRGLFILNTICQKIYYDNHNIVVEYDVGGIQ